MKQNIDITKFLHSLIPESNKLPTKLNRLPVKNLKEVRHQALFPLSKTGANEIRFIMQDETAEISFELGNDGGIIDVYYGDFLHEARILSPGHHNFVVTEPDQINELKKTYKPKGFSLDVVRLMIKTTGFTLKNFQTIFHGIS